MTSDQSNLGQARHERDEAQDRFQITFDANPAPSMILRLEDTVVVKTNPGLNEVSGRDNDEVEGRSVRDLGMFTDPDAFETILSNLKRGEALYKERLVMASRTQGGLTMLVSAKPIDMEAGPCAIFTFADVTELEQAVEAARRSEERFRQAFMLAPISATISTFGSGETFLDSNEAFLRLTGYAREEVIGQNIFDLAMWSSREDQRKLREAQEDGRGFRELELQLRHKDGTIYDVLLSAEVIRLNGHEGYLRMFYDITDRKRTEGEMHQAVQSLMSETSWFSQELIARLKHFRSGGTASDYRQVELSPRERQVLELLAEGHSNATIAERLELKVQTVRNYITNLYEKLGVHNRTEAAVWARERGFTRRG